MKLGRYISIAVSTLVIFMIAWIAIGSFGWPQDGSTPYIKGIVSSLIFIALIIHLISIIVPMLIRSIKTIFTFKKENGLWKLLTLCFGTGMTVFAGLIAILSFVWIIFALKDGVLNTKSPFPMPNMNENKFDNWISNNFISAKYYITNDSGFGGAASLLGFSGSPFGLLTTSFVFVQLWCVAGIVFEVLKKALSGNQKNNNTTVEVQNQ